MKKRQTRRKFGSGTSPYCASSYSESSPPQSWQCLVKPAVDVKLPLVTITYIQAISSIKIVSFSIEVDVLLRFRYSLFPTTTVIDIPFDTRLCGKIGYRTLRENTNSLDLTRLISQLGMATYCLVCVLSF